jgi:carboxyl-terminal processing protease
LKRIVDRGVTPAEAGELTLRQNHSFLRNVLRLDTEGQQASILSALAHAYDPHSDFMSKRTVNDFRIAMQQELAGVGMSTGIVDGVMEVQRIIKNGPIHKHGRIAVKDQIVALGEGVSGEWTDVSELTLAEAVDIMRGEPGTTLRLRIHKPGQSKAEEMRIVRDRVDLSADAVRSYLLTEKAADGSESKVGYIAMPVFYSRKLLSGTDAAAQTRECEQDVAEELASLKKRGAEVVVLDFSGNNGGGLQNSVEIPGLFIGRNPVLQSKSRNNHVNLMGPQATSLVWDGPLVVVLDRRCAGSPEIVAAALQDYGRALIVGGRATHGMGCTAGLYDPMVSDQSKVEYSVGAIRISNNAFYRPSGRTTQFVGVDSDIWIPSVYDQWQNTESTADNPLEFSSIAAVPFRRNHHVTDELKRALQRSSEERRASSATFVAYQKAIDRYHELSGRELLPLEEAAFREHQQALKEVSDVLLDNADEGALSRNPFTNEAISIAADYASYAREHADYFNGPRLLVGGKFDEAIAVFDRLLVANPDDRNSHRLRAQALASLGKWAEALKAAESAQETSVRAYSTADTKLTAEGAAEQTIAGRRHCNVTHVNGEWIYVVDRDTPEVKGWAMPETIRPLLDGR